MEIIIAAVQAGQAPPVPRPPLSGVDPSGLAKELGVTSPFDIDT